MELEPGLSIRLSGPVGSFYLKEPAEPTLLVVGGMGVTPFRAILKDIERQGQSAQPIQLLYVDNSETYLFKDELAQIDALPNVSITFLTSIEEAFVTNHQENGQYYVAGPTSFVQSMVNHLKDKNVSKKQIHKDGFYGYA